MQCRKRAGVPVNSSGLCVVATICLCASWLHAGVITIGPLTPFSNGGPTPGIEGIAFDGTPNALVIDTLSWAVSRVSLQNAAVLSSTVSMPLPPDNYNDQLVFDHTTGNFYTIEDDTTLVKIAPGTFANSTVGSTGQFFNFTSLAADPAGNLWIGTDHNGGELWSVNKQTGLATFQTHINVPSNHQLTSLAIDEYGNFLIYALSNAFNLPNDLCSVNPATGATAILAPGATGVPVFADAMSYDPLTKSFYAVMEDRTSSFTYSLARITGVPEPTSAILAAGAVLLLRRRHRSIRP
jgi:DNA-binding beta-propeller fold protein YncE